MIKGINPFHIVEIKFKPFRRVGMHPYIEVIKARQKRWIDRKWLNYKYPCDPFCFEFVEPARVNIMGANNKCLLQLCCKSNREAIELTAKLNSQMDDFFTSMGVLYKLKDGL